MKCSICKNRISKKVAWIVKGYDNYHPLCYVVVMAAEIDRLKEALALERSAYVELEIDYRNAEHGLALADSENEQLKATIAKQKSGNKATVNLQDAVDGAEKAGKRIDDWPTWKQSIAYRYHDTDGDKEVE